MFGLLVDNCSRLELSGGGGSRFGCIDTLRGKRRDKKAREKQRKERKKEEKRRREDKALAPTAIILWQMPINKYFMGIYSQSQPG